MDGQNESNLLLCYGINRTILQDVKILQKSSEDRDLEQGES